MPKKKKIHTNNQCYAIEKSPLYKLRYPYQLKSLNIPLKYRVQQDDYHCFYQGSRLIQTPIGELYDIHHRIASLLCRIKLPDYLYSGIKKRSYLENAQQHLTQPQVLTTDICAFFASTTRTKVFWFFREYLQCAEYIANYLADLTAIDNHLPTGSQISMPLAYWVNAKMFDELFELANKHQLKMTVYVDDLTFSGQVIPKGFLKQVKAIVQKYAHKIKEEKTIFYTKHNYKEITGLILKGAKIELPKRQYQQLHQRLTDWKNAIAITHNQENIKKMYPKLLGTLTYINRFNRKYQPVIYAITQEYEYYYLTNRPTSD